jgi:pimeloyl-ACP methyl ester carboxylesterase
LLNGWLYLPLKEGRYPLVILTNGGGAITRNIRSFSDWLAPILAHCGIAAFVHDKRGTGESEGVFKETTYDDYIIDAGNCARYFLNHENIDITKIGVIGASEGGRIAYLAAGRYPEICFAVSFAGAVVGMVDDRINAQRGYLQSIDLPDSVISEVMILHEKSYNAWKANTREAHSEVNREILDYRTRYRQQILPFTKAEMDSIPDFENGLPTWYSIPNDYLSELEHFNKKWLAIFGEMDHVVPTRASVDNIVHYMNISRNNNYNVAVIPDCGHSPLSLKTNKMIRIDNLIINWLSGQIRMEDSD